MNLNRIWLIPSLLTALAFGAHGQSGLQVTFGNNGLDQLTYNGTVLASTGAYPGDHFYIGHMKVTDLSGNQLSGSQYNWGEINNGRNWNSFTHTFTYPFNWGSISVQFVQNGSNLDMNVTEHNNAGSGVILDGAVIYPFVLHFPQLPANFIDSNYEQLAFNTTGPSVTVADYGSGEVTAVVTDATKPLYSGFEPAGSPNAYTPIVSGTGLDNMATFFPRNERPVAPGQTDSFTVSLRFTPSGTPASATAADALRNWTQQFPSTLNWPDRRIIGTAYLASSGTGDSNHAAGFPNNPRRYFNDGNASDFDVRTAGGLAAFQSRIIQAAQNDVANLNRLNAQGMITWDLEGQEYPHATSYVCSPDQIAQIAPEMDSVISDPSSPYNGMKLDDAYFKIMRDAGFRVGVCIRPQHFTLYGNGTAEQVFLPNNQIAGELTSKMKFAHDRWGVTLFYVDSAVDANGGTLDPAIFQQVAANLPDSLIIPEESTPRYYAFTAPFQTFIFHTDLGTQASIYDSYPKAFSVNLINDVDAGKLAQYRSQLTDSVRRGDILMLHADFWHPNNDTAVAMYQDAGVVTSKITPTTPAPVTSAPAPVANPTPITPTTVDLQPVATPDPVSTPVIVPTPVPAPTPAPVAAPAPVITAPAPVTTTPAPATPSIPAVTPSSLPTPNGPVTITSVVGGAVLSGSLMVYADIHAALDAAGSILLVDGVQITGCQWAGIGWASTLDTKQFSNGTHWLQVWAHTINNDALVSQPVNVTFQN